MADNENYGKSANAFYAFCVLGLSEVVAVDVIAEETVVGDVYLLCFDGLTEMLDDDEVQTTMKEGNPERLTPLSGRAQPRAGGSLRSRSVGEHDG